MFLHETAELNAKFERRRPPTSERRNKQTIQKQVPPEYNVTTEYLQHSNTSTHRVQKGETKYPLRATQLKQVADVKVTTTVTKQLRKQLPAEFKVINI